MASPKSKKPPRQIDPTPSQQSDCWLAISIAAVTMTVFSPALANEFVRWDDYELLVDNLRYRGLGWEQLRWMFSTFHQGHYQPLSWITLAFDYVIWRMDPVGYHLTNIVIHGANAALFYLVAQRLLCLAWASPATDLSLRAAAGFAALFFAIHPLRVESVAWATERRDVLSGLFFLATIFCYLRAVGDLKGASAFTSRWFYAALVCYVLSLLAKASSVTLPVVLVLLDIYPLKRFSWSAKRAAAVSLSALGKEKLPFALLAVAAGILAPLAQSDAAAVASLKAHSIAARLAQSFYGLAFYLWKTVWPLDLSPFYEVPPRLDPLAWPFLLSAALVAAISLALLWLRHRWPAGLTSWVYYAIVVAPVLGWVQSGRQLVADRYSYLSCLPWAILLGSSFFFRQQSDRQQPLARGVVAAVIVIALGTLTVRQISVWRNTDTLFDQVLAVTDRSVFKSATAHHLVANFMTERGDLDGAIGHLRRSIAIEPNDFTTYNDLGVMLGRRGRLEEAAESFAKALALDPQISLSHLNLANVLALQGNLATAIVHLQEAQKLNPDYPQAYNNLGKIYAAQGQLEKALEQFRQAIHVQPEFGEAHRSLALALNEAGKSEDAARAMQEYERIMKRRAANSK